LSPVPTEPPTTEKASVVGIVAPALSVRLMGATLRFALPIVPAAVDSVAVL
jgi:hypothetical protein